MFEIAGEGLVNNPLLWNTHFCIPNFFIERDIQARNEVSNTEHKIYPYFYTVTKLKLLCLLIAAYEKTEIKKTHRQLLKTDHQNRCLEKKWC